MIKAQPVRSDVSVEETRANFESLAAAFPVADDVKREKASANGVPGEWLTPPGVSGDITIYWLHGGGYTVGSVSTHARLVAQMAAACDARAFAVDYRLAPENPFPAGLDDAVAGYRWLLARGVDPARLVIGGDSAGGGLTLATLQRLREAGDPLPAATVLLSPWTDLEGTGESIKTRREADPMIDPASMPEMARGYHPDGDVRNPLVSPLHADFTGLPPMLIQVGDAEVLLDDSTRVYKLADAAGVDVTLEVNDEMIHVFQFFAPLLPEAVAAIERIGEFAKSHAGATAAAR
ncbi:MAG: alpha/beta hydrolase [Chloroflexi bacterium]|nr:alpha/beta hydrolase [Chloroflexota bacterium]